MKKIEIHISYDPESPAALHPDADRILKEIESFAENAAAIALTSAPDREGVPEGAEVVYSSGALTAAAARAAAPGLRWMQITSAGVEKHMAGFPGDLILTNASGVHAAKGGEYALAAALMLNFRIPKFVADRAARRWQPVFGPTLAARTVTLLGTGAIGAGAARALRPTGCRLIGINRGGASDAPLDLHATLDALDEVLAETDILISTLPLTPLTENLVDRRRIDLLPLGAGVVVLGRAKVLDYEAIYDRLDAGSLSGAVLEVLPKEPAGPEDRAWSTPGVILSPHCNVDDHTTYGDACDGIFLANLKRYLGGLPLENRVEPSLGY